jgi:choline monooxygenase
MTLDLLRDDFEHALDADPARAHTLPASFYLDPEIFEREKETIFYRHWHYVGHFSQLEKAGDYLTARIADEPIFVMRGEDGALRGFYNVCRHRAHELLEGSGRVKSIVCPYHAWTYRSDGSLRHARNSHKVPGFDHGAFCLPQIRVETFCGFVFVNLDRDAEPLSSVTEEVEEELRADVPFIDDLRPFESWSFSASSIIAANWKVVVDNFLECYHCDKAHPDFCDLFEMSAYETEIGPWWSLQRGPKVRAENNAYRVANDERVQTGMFYFLWPTTTINMLPGEANLSVMSILPHGIDGASFSGHRYALPGTELDPDQKRYLNEVLVVEDQNLCESVQRGLRSRSYNQGRFIYSPDERGISEHAVHHFHRLVHEALEEGA